MWATEFVRKAEEQTGNESTFPTKSAICHSEFSCVGNGCVRAMNSKSFRSGEGGIFISRRRRGSTFSPTQAHSHTSVSLRVFCARYSSRVRLFSFIQGKKKRDEFLPPSSPPPRGIQKRKKSLSFHSGEFVRHVVQLFFKKLCSFPRTL